MMRVQHKVALLSAMLTLFLISISCGGGEAEFQVTSFELTPDVVVSGESTTVTATVENVGGKEGTYVAILRVDGQDTEVQQVIIQEGETAAIAFQLLREIGPSSQVELGGITKTLTINEGVLPVLSEGDIWVSRLTLEGVEYTATTTVVGEEVVNGVNAYLVQITIDPPLLGVVTLSDMKIHKDTLDPIRIQATGNMAGFPFITAVTYDYKYFGPKYPYVVGNEYRLTTTEDSVVTVLGTTETESETTTSRYKVEGIETITVAAGTFRAFKVVEYDENGEAVSTSWHSDKVKLFEVKSINHEDGETTELISYSILGKE